MIALNKQSAATKTIKLLPQEKEGNYTFSGRFVATRNAIEKFGNTVIVAAHIMLLKEVKQRKGKAWITCRSSISTARSCGLSMMLAMLPVFCRVIISAKAKLQVVYYFTIVLTRIRIMYICIITCTDIPVIPQLGSYE